MSTSYYRNNPLLFDSEQALITYLNKQSVTKSDMAVFSTGEIKQASDTFPFYRILMIGGCVILAVIIVTELARLKYIKMEARAENQEILRNL